MAVIAAGVRAEHDRTLPRELPPQSGERPQLLRAEIGEIVGIEEEDDPSAPERRQRDRLGLRETPDVCPGSEVGCWLTDAGLHGSLLLPHSCTYLATVRKTSVQYGDHAR